MSKASCFKGGIGITLLFFLVACSPKLNWRTVQSPQSNYVALFPGKPEKIERQLQYQDQAVLQTLEAVKIDDDIYSVSAIHLSKEQVDLLPAVLAQLQGNLFQRAGVQELGAISDQSVYQTVNHQRQPLKEYFLTFPAGAIAQQAMRVCWITRASDANGAWLYQVSVLHTAPITEASQAFFSGETYSNFFDGFHPD